MSFLDAAGATGLTPCAAVYGVGLGDYNADNHTDVVVSCGDTEPLRLFRNEGLRFTDVSDTLQAQYDPTYNDRRVPTFGPPLEGGSASLFVPTGGGNGQGQGYDQLFSLADGVWTDLAATLEIQDPAGGARFGLWLDVDVDGDEDLFVGHRTYPESAERDHHVIWDNGSWLDRGADWGVPNTLASAGSAVAADWDGDGRVELLLTHRCVGTEPSCSDDPVGVSAWLRGADGMLDPKLCTALGELSTAAAAELNGDGKLDLVVGRIGAPALVLLNPGDGSGPCDWSGQALSDDTANATALVAADFDNDGAVDLFLGTVNADGEHPPIWLTGDGDGGFQALAETGPVLWPRNGRVMAAPLDIDADGWMDLVVIAEGITDAASLRLLRNELGERGGDAGAYELWLDDGPRATVGTRVSVGGRHVAVAGGGGWRTSGAPMVHLGAGHTTSATVEITWPDGTIQTHEDVAPGCYRAIAADEALDPC